MLIAVLGNDFCTGSRNVSQNPPAGRLAKGFYDLFRKSIGVRGQRLFRHNPGNLPMADGCVLAHGCFGHPSVGRRRRLGLGQTTHTIDIAQSGGNQLGNVQFAGRCARGQRMHSMVPKLRSIRQSTDAERIQYE